MCRRHGHTHGVEYDTHLHLLEDGGLARLAGTCGRGEKEWKGCALTLLRHNHAEWAVQEGLQPQRATPQHTLPLFTCKRKADIAHTRREMPENVPERGL